MIDGLALIAATVLAQVILRGGETAPAGEIVHIDAAGIVLGPPPGTLVIGWDRVKTVEGSWADKAAPFQADAERAWRARTRLERGDSLSAEPIFEKLFETYRGQTGATASVVAEGLLRCRLRRGAHVAAIDPWLAMLVAAPPSGMATPVFHPTWAAEAGLSPAMDAATGLVPALPPMWLSWPSVEAFARQTPPDIKDPKTAALRVLYLLSAQFECATEDQTWTVPPAGANESGSQIVREIVLSRVGDVDQRASARKWLEERMRGSTANPTPPWLEAWCRAAIGRSLLREDSADQKRLGVVELLHIPARFSTMHPYLAGMALAEASVTLRSLGDAPGADTLARELAETYPSHPVLEWPRFRSAAPARKATSGPGAATK